MKEKMLVERIDLSADRRPNDERRNTTQQYTHHRLRNTEESNQLTNSQTTRMDQPLHFAPDEMLSQGKTSNSICLQVKGMATDLVGHNNQPETKLFTRFDTTTNQYNNQTAWKWKPVE
jgi:alpha-ketoglutarate-dependent taurine dioxygenase